MVFRIEHQCPQCGAPVELEESDHLLPCPYCRVQRFLFAPDFFRLVLPHKAPGKDIFYAPYLRFKGAVFSFRLPQGEVQHRLVDVTQTGVALKGLPVSLGLRPQAMKMRFVSPGNNGSFLRNALSVADLLARAERPFQAPPGESIVHQVSIGESVHLIYLPLYAEKQRLLDAITHTPVDQALVEEDAVTPLLDQSPPWKLQFLACICPQCGWNLEGERDSVVLFCTNCQTAWEAGQGKFVSLDHATVQGGRSEDRYLPFWKIRVRSVGDELAALTAMLRLVHPARFKRLPETQDSLTLWIPAFKIRPRVFLALSRQLTLGQEIPKREISLPRKNRHPVTLPLTEAIQAASVLLADVCPNKRRALPLVSSMSLKVMAAALIHVPFEKTSHELIHRTLKVAIQRNSLALGRYL